MTTSLNDSIRALTAALSQQKSVDKESRLQLHALAHEIARLTEHHDASVAERLEAMAVRFETEHPAVGTALRQAVDALGKAGI